MNHTPFIMWAVGWIASHSTLYEVDELFQVSNFDFCSTVGDALNSLDIVYNSIHHLVGMGDGRVGNILVSELNCGGQVLASC